MRVTRAVVGCLSVLWLGGCVLEYGEWDGSWGDSDGPYVGEGYEEPGYMERAVPVEQVEMRGRVVLRDAAGDASGQLHVLESVEGGDLVVGMFAGPARGPGAVMVAPEFSLDAFLRAREEGRVVFASALLDEPPMVEEEEEEADAPLMSGIVCSGPDMGAWEEEASIDTAELVVTEGSEPGMERAELRIVGSFIDDGGIERRFRSGVRFEYDPVLLFGEEAQGGALR